MQLAAQIGVATSTLGTWLEAESFPAKYVMPICNVLQISPERLLLGVDKPMTEIPSEYVQLTNEEAFLIETLRGLDREGAVVVLSKAVEEARRIRDNEGK